MPILRLVVLEIQHRLRQLDELGLLSPSIRRFVLDENVPGMSLTIVPELSPGDFMKLLENPTPEALDYWVHKGERSVWPAIGSIQVRTAIEVELDRGYQVVRRRRPVHRVNSTGSGGTALKTSGSQGEVARARRRSEDRDHNDRLERRQRAKSLGNGIGL